MTERVKSDVFSYSLKIGSSGNVMTLGGKLAHVSIKESSVGIRIRIQH